MFKKGQRVEYTPLGAYATVAEDQCGSTVKIKWDDWKTRKRGKEVVFKGSTIGVLAMFLKLVG